MIWNKWSDRFKNSIRLPEGPGIEYSIRNSLAREMASKRHRVNYKDASSSGSDMTLEIDNTAHISSNTSRWTKEDCIALKILYVNASDIAEIIMMPQLDDHYKQLELKGWDRQRFYLASDSDYRTNPSRKIATIMRKVANVLRNEQQDHRRENKVDSFVMSLLEYLGFDDDPLLMHPQYDFISNDHKITSKVEYMITRGDAYVVLKSWCVIELVGAHNRCCNLRSRLIIM